jgi:hypothetical protein
VSYHLDRQRYSFVVAEVLCRLEAVYPSTRCPNRATNVFARTARTSHYESGCRLFVDVRLLDNDDFADVYAGRIGDDLYGYRLEAYTVMLYCYLRNVKSI